MRPGQMFFDQAFVVKQLMSSKELFFTPYYLIDFS